MAKNRPTKRKTSKKQADKIPPGFELLHTLRGHEGEIWEIAFSPDGKTLASGSSDNTIRVWDRASGELLRTLKGHSDKVLSMSWSPDGKTLASGSSDETIHLWDPVNGNLCRTLVPGKLGLPFAVSWSPDGRFLATGSGDDLVCIWDAASAELLHKELAHSSAVFCVSWSPDGRTLASGGHDKTIRLWDAAGGGLRTTLETCGGAVYRVCWSPDGRTLASGSGDNTIRLWDAPSGRQLSILEGHTAGVCGVCFSPDGRLLCSKSWDGMVRLWRADTFESVAVLDEPSLRSMLGGLAFHPTEPILATLGERDAVIRIWRLDYDVLLGGKPATQSVRYTTARVVLVGDSGVGKTGLGWRLKHKQFKEHSSTHGQQFWVIDELGTTRSDGTECEAVVWDLAGQPDYRLVHSLYLDDVDLALVLFDPTNRQEPLGGVDFWLNQLRQSGQTLCPCILIGARADRGTPTLTEAELDAYCKRQGIGGAYMATSAKEGAGVDALIEHVKAQIPWDAMTATVTTTTFKRVKEYVLSLKEDERRSEVLVNPAKLRERLQAMDADWEFSDDEMMTAVRHLETHGYVTILRGSQGNVSILLAPSVLTNLASSFVLEARRNPRGLGVLEENQLLRGDYKFPELTGLTEDEQEILLDAAMVLFIQHNICFRETFNEQTFVVFPSLINEKRPADEGADLVDDVSYRASGAVENVYASMVVLLGYTNTFTRRNQWQNQAQYEMGAGEICGFRQTITSDGEIELVLYYRKATPEHARLLFRGLFERFLSGRELEIARYKPVVCPKCGERLARNVVMVQLEKKRPFSFCHGCGEKVALPGKEAVTPLPVEDEKHVAAQQVVAQRRTAFEAALVRVKGLLRDRGDVDKRPSCFISYAWGVAEHQRWVLQLAKDLRNAGIGVLFDRWHNPPGTNLSRFTDQILSSDYVVVVGTPKLREKYDTKASDPVVAAELLLINTRLQQPTRYGPTVIPLLLAGDSQSAFTPMLQGLVCIQFLDEDLHFVNLFDLIWRLFELPFDHPLLEDLRASMGPQRM